MTNPTPADGRLLADRAAMRLLHSTSHPRTDVLRAAVADKVVLVTGASHGIGKAVVRELAAAGAIVLLVVRSRENLGAVMAQIAAAGGVAHVYDADLTDMAATDRLGRALLGAHGRVDVVINNPDPSIRRPIDQSYGHIRDFTVDVNYLGPVRLLLTLLPSMRARRDGHIVNVSSWGSHVPPSPRWSYTASKAAFDTWLRTVATEIAEDNVTTSSVYVPLAHARPSERAVDTADFSLVSERVGRTGERSVRSINVAEPALVPGRSGRPMNTAAVAVMPGTERQRGAGMGAPTDFGAVRGLTVEEAAGLVCHAIVARPVEISPWRSGPPQAWSDISRGPAQRPMSGSSAIRGERAGGGGHGRGDLTYRMLR